VPEVPVLTLDQLAFDEAEQEIITMTTITETVKATLVQARRGQGIFRSRVQTIEKHCRVTGVNAEKFLIASHIKPWSKSENDERLDGNNGLFLSPHIDKLFDSGFVSFTQKGAMLVSPLLDPDVLAKWSIDSQMNVGKFNNDQAYFLEHHNQNTFKNILT
jgi:predicted restriction endonuclease